MTMIEKQMHSTEKELEKYMKSLERNEALLQKKKDLQVKLNCVWSNEEWNDRLQQMSDRHTNECIIPFGNDDDIITGKQNGVMWDIVHYTSTIEDLKKSIANAQKRLDKQTCEFLGVKEAEQEQEEIENMKSLYEDYFSKTLEQREAEYQAWLAQFKAECLKDGVIINEASHAWINGTTKSGKRFSMVINSGFTARSFHCYTLTINGETIFTSGTFNTAYRIVRR